MKVLYCKECKDLFNLSRKVKKCKCGKTRGKYINWHSAVYAGKNAVPIGIENPSFKKAIVDKEAYKDYKDKKTTTKQMSLKAHEFIQRFLWHVLPEGFHKIRHYGFLANGKAKTKVAQIRELLQQRLTNKEEESCKDNAGMLCPICKKGRLIPSLIMDRFRRIIVRTLTFLSYRCS